jgi:hypothetical protein
MKTVFRSGQFGELGIKTFNIAWAGVENPDPANFDPFDQIMLVTASR